MVKEPNYRTPAMKEVHQNEAPRQKRYFQSDIVWFNAIGFLVLHLLAIYGAYLFLFFRLKWQTMLFSVFVGMSTSQGVLAGAHRFYSHRSYKANLPLRAFFVFWHTIASQNCMWVWVRDHRQHHKFSDTDADPHNASRGVFFSHIGWLMMKKHPEVIEKGKTIDMSDLDSDPLVMFQKKYYVPLYIVFALLLPVAIPVYCWEETVLNAFLGPFLLRMIVVLNITWCVNSWAHAFGSKPYDKNIRPVETLAVSIMTFGEGWHNYHHAFPWDYKASEYGLRYNPTTRFIDLMSRLGFASDLKQASTPIVNARVLRSGDGTHPKMDDLVNFRRNGTKDGDQSDVSGPEVYETAKI